MISRTISRMSLMCAAAVLVACGGGGGGTATPAASTTISGAVVKGPVAGATVTVRNAATSAVLGSTTTGAGGIYSLAVPFTGDVVVEVTGGTYTDEATAAATTLAAPLRVVLNANGGSVNGVVTPLTTMAYTYAFGTGGSTVTATAFNTVASRLVTQFQLGETNLSTTVPAVSGTLNDYGRVLAGISQYLNANGVTLQTLVNTALNSTQSVLFSTQFSAAYAAANPGAAPITFSFDGSTLNVAGTGAGGGSGSCGVNVQGTVASGGITVPVSFDYCIAGITAASCNSGNSTLSQAVSGQGTGGAANLVYNYGPTCAAGAVTIRLQ